MLDEEGKLQQAFTPVIDATLGDADELDPLASPIFGRFAGAPPVLLQASRAEVLYDDSLRLAALLEAQGVEVLLQSWDNTPHVWQFFHGYLPEADAAMDGIARFVTPLLETG